MDEKIAAEAADKNGVKKLNKPIIIAIAAVVVLAVAFAIILPIYLKDNEDERALYRDQSVRFLENGEEIGIYTFEQLEALCSPEEFSAVYDTSNSDPVTKTYTGFELKNLLSGMGIDLQDKTGIRLTGSDGAEKVYSIADVTADNNVFIAYLVNGKPFNTGIDSFGYLKPEEDGGPLVVIKAADVFSFNRMKLLVEIEVL